MKFFVVFVSFFVIVLAAAIIADAFSDLRIIKDSNVESRRNCAVFNEVCEWKPCCPMIGRYCGVVQEPSGNKTLRCISDPGKK